MVENNEGEKTGGRFQGRWADVLSETWAEDREGQHRALSRVVRGETYTF